MNVFFKIYLNQHSGLGHLSRCLIIAEKLPINYKIFFLTDSIFDLKKLIKIKKKITYINLYNNKKKFKTEKKDLKIFIDKSFELKKSIVIVDDYRIGNIWTKKIHKLSKKLIVLDDLANRKLTCNTYINYKIVTDTNYKKKISNLLNKDSVKLLGNKYCIINKNLKKIKNNKNKKKIMINFGNSFNFNHIHDLLKKIFYKIINKNKNLHLIIVIGPKAINYKKTFNFFLNKNKCKIIYKNFGIYNFLNEINFFIGSSGNAIYENSYLNIPSIFFSLNKNQQNNIFDLEKLGHYFFLEKNELKNQSKIIEFLKIFFIKNSKLQKMYKSKEIKLDKSGPDRIIKKIISK